MESHVTQGSVEGKSRKRVPPSGDMYWPPLLSIAPMLDVTDRHFRYFMRCLSRRVFLWTEMVHASAVVHNLAGTANTLGYNIPFEQPVVLQLGGSDEDTIKRACQLALPFGFYEFNLNVGCPSNKAGKGCFGAVLMRDATKVASLCVAMRSGLEQVEQCGNEEQDEVPVTVKCRIGVDDSDSYEELLSFIRTVSEQGNVKHFIIHARKALLNGLTPDQNRRIPPLRYDVVFQLVKDFPNLKFTINGGVKSVAEAKALLDARVYGVMVGRAISHSPWEWRQVDNKIFGETEDPCRTREDLLGDYCIYAEKVEASSSGREWYVSRRTCSIAPTIIDSVRLLTDILRLAAVTTENDDVID